MSVSWSLLCPHFSFCSSFVLLTLFTVSSVHQCLSLPLSVFTRSFYFLFYYEVFALSLSEFKIYKTASTFKLQPCLVSLYLYFCLSESKTLERLGSKWPTLTYQNLYRENMQTPHGNAQPDFKPSDTNAASNTDNRWKACYSFCIHKIHARVSWGLSDVTFNIRWWGQDSL